MAQGSSYDPSPDLANPGDPSRADHHYAVGHSDGRVTRYAMRNPSGSSIAAAQTVALAEFPSDATTLWFTPKDICAEAVIQSPTVGVALDDPENREWRVLVTFYTSERGGGLAYRAEDVNEMIFLPINAANPNEAPSC